MYKTTILTKLINCQEVKTMARFCTYCGSPLEEGQACVCTQQAATADPSIQQTIQEGQQPTQPQNQEYQQESQPLSEQSDQQPNQQPNQPPYQQPNQPPYQQTNPQMQPQYGSQNQQQVYSENEFVKFMKRMLAIVTTFARNPVGTVKEAAKQADMFTGFFFTAVLALMMSFYSVILIMSSGLGTLLAFSGSYISYYLGTLFKTLLAGVIQYFILTAVIFGISKIFKSKCNYKSILSGIGVASIPVIAGVIVAMIFTWFMPTFAFLVITFSILMSIILVFPLLGEVAALNENKITYTITISYIVYYAVYVLIIVQQLKLYVSGLLGGLGSLF